MERQTFERALHAWPEWHESIKKSRKVLGYRTWWPKKKRLAWIDDNIRAVREQGEKELKRMELPTILHQYWEDCLYTPYRGKDGKLHLQRITRCLSKRRSLPPLPFDQRIVWEHDTDIDRQGVRLEIRIPSRFAVKKTVYHAIERADKDLDPVIKRANRELFDAAARHAFKTLEADVLLRDIEPHPVCHWLSGGRPQINEERAIECARLREDEGLSEKNIGIRFGWTLQEDSYGNRTQCRTARRYVRRGRELIKKLRT